MKMDHPTFRRFLAERVLGDEDLLGQVLKKVTDGKSRKRCSEVSRLWAKVEAITRTSLKIIREPDIDLTILRRYPNLTDLNLFVTECGDLGKSELISRCRNLTKFSLTSTTSIDDVALTALLKNAKNLSSLYLSCCYKITDRSLEEMSISLTSLTELYLKGDPRIEDHGIVCLANGWPAKSLRVLHLTDCLRLTDNGLAHLGKMSCLQDLSLSKYLGDKVTDITGVAISSIYTLRTLDLSWLNISDVTLSSLFQKCHDLVDVNLRGCKQVRGSGIGHKSLQVLTVASSGMSAGDAELLASNFPSLKCVTLGLRLRKVMSNSAIEKLSIQCTVK